MRNTVASAAATHYDPRCIWSAVLVNLAVASLVSGAALAPFGIAGDRLQLPAEVAGALSGLPPAAPEEIGLDGDAMGYTLKAMQVALWCALRAPDFEEAMVAVVSAGGDTDTNGAVAGAVLGARFGCRAIPPRWRGAVARLRPGRQPMEAWADRLLRLSCRAPGERH